MYLNSGCAGHLDMQGSMPFSSTLAPEILAISNVAHHSHD
jgi:hypothetical protein